VSPQLFFLFPQEWGIKGVDDQPIMEDSCAWIPACAGMIRLRRTCG